MAILSKNLKEMLGMRSGDGGRLPPRGLSVERLPQLEGLTTETSRREKKENAHGKEKENSKELWATENVYATSWK